MYMQYEQTEAIKAGQHGASESGAYTGQLLAIPVTASTGSKGIEFSLITDSGEINYLNAYHTKADGSQIKGGYRIIQAIMGLLNVQSLSTSRNLAGIECVPELMQKDMGFVLQKVLYSKKDGTDGYKFEILMPFCAKTRRTLGEFVANKQPSTVDKLVSSLFDKDERRGGGVPQQQSSVGGFASYQAPQPIGQGYQHPQPQPQQQQQQDQRGALQGYDDINF